MPSAMNHRGSWVGQLFHRGLQIRALLVDLTPNSTLGPVRSRPKPSSMCAVGELVKTGPYRGTGATGQRKLATPEIQEERRDMLQRSYNAYKMRDTYAVAAIGRQTDNDMLTRNPFRVYAIIRQGGDA